MPNVRAAKMFGARIVAERQYKGKAGSRETDSGLIELQQQLPVFTQNAPEYDVLVCAEQIRYSPATCPTAPGMHARHRLGRADPDKLGPEQHGVRRQADAGPISSPMRTAR